MMELHHLIGFAVAIATAALFFYVITRDWKPDTVSDDGMKV